MRRNIPAIASLVLAGLAILILGIMLVRERLAPGAKSAKEATAVASDDRQKRCASQRTYDRIKGELFRRAVQSRGSDRASFDRLSSYSVVRMEQPLLTGYDEEIGTLRCSGRLSLDLPPGVVVVGGRRTLAANIDYVLQPAADGSGDVVMLEGADAIVVPLATLASTQDNSALPSPSVPAEVPADEMGETAQEPPRTATRATPQPQTIEPGSAPSGPATANARPSFNCRYARTRGEIAVCNDGGLATLDRQMAAQYYRAIAAANARQRQSLTHTRDQFLRYRDRCPSKACIAETYRGRMRQIGDIMAGN